jgi:hypothetical protein
MPEAIRFYETAGFDVESYDSGFAFVHYAGASVFDLDLKENVDPTNNSSPPTPPTTGTYDCRRQGFPSRRSPTCHGACASSPSPIQAVTVFASRAAPDRACRASASVRFEALPGLAAVGRLEENRG